MQSIETKYYHDRNGNPKISATSSSKYRVIVYWVDALDIDDNHHAAVKVLCKKLKWKGKFAYGGAKAGKGNVYVFIRDYNILRIK